jgi:MtN3 and saliva related transmembrane protein
MRLDKLVVFVGSAGRPQGQGRAMEGVGNMTITTETWILILGTLGGFCTTFAFVPQVIKIWKQGGRDLSYGMLGLYLFGVVLWLAYGVLLHAQAVAITNFATMILIAIATALKAWTARRDEIKQSLGQPAVERS